MDDDHASPLEHGVRLRAGRLALLGGIAVLGAKLAAWQLTGSTAVFSDALESFVNVAAGALLLYSLYLSSQPADRNHPYGHGKVEFFSAGVEGTLIALAAVLIGITAVKQLIRGVELRSLDLGLVLVTAATAANAAIGLHLIRVGRRVHSLALVADGRHLLTDVVTSVGVIIGLALVWLTGLSILDPIVALIVAAQILATGWQLSRQAIGGLMDEADPASLEEMVKALEVRRDPWWIDTHSLRAWRSGAVGHVDLHMVVPRYFDADRLHDIDDQVERTVLAATRRPGDVITHFDPCRPRHCAACAMEPCSVRSVPCAGMQPFTVDHATRSDETLDTGTPIERVKVGG